MALGTVWASGTWATGVWADNTWANAVVAQVIIGKQPTAVYPWEITQGATVPLLVAYEEDDAVVSLASYTARMQIRRGVNDSTTLLDLTTEDVPALLTIDGSGKVSLTLTPAVTDLLDFDDAVYDLEVEHPTSRKVYRLLKGAVALSKAVTT